MVDLSGLLKGIQERRYLVAALVVAAACSSSESGNHKLNPGAGGSSGSGPGTPAGSSGASGVAGEPSAGMAGSAGSSGAGSAGSSGAGSGGVASGGSSGMAGMGGGAVTGAFRMLVFSKTAGFRHDSIAAGIAMLDELAKANDFEITATENAADLSDAGLEPYRVLFFMNTRGDVLNAEQESAVEAFIRKGRGFAGTHSATDTEYDWPWYEELVGARFSEHGGPSDPGTLEIDPSAANHPAVLGLPASWNRNDEWYKFNRDVTGRTGVQVLLRFAADDRPMAWTRVWDGGRAFYAAGGHAAGVFDEPLFRQHVLGGILWAAGRFP